MANCSLEEIRGFDGERKALVYDNYSKLIGATDTIRKMRTNMDPLTPATSTLTPAISHIAETAQQLSSSLKQLVPDMPREDPKRKQRQTVRWVLGAPSRLRRLRSEGKVEEAQKDLEEVSKLLEKWKGVQGVEEVKKECEEIMQDDG